MATPVNFVIEWHDRLESTNTTLRERARRDPALPEGLVVAARVQTAGRGRGARNWTAGDGGNLTFSVLLRPDGDRRKLASLPMAAALAVTDLLALHGVAARVKWPNDVLVEGRKIAGILQEVLADCTVILGIGLNVNMGADEAARIVPPAHSLRAATGRVLQVDAVLGSLLSCLGPRLAVWTSGGFEGLRGDWEARDSGIRPPASGAITGYGGFGEFRVRRPDGTDEPLWSD